MPYAPGPPWFLVPGGFMQELTDKLAELEARISHVLVRL